MNNPLQVAAQFAAYTWYLNQPENQDKTQEQAHQFSRLNWARFLTDADANIGRLLMDMGAARKRAVRRSKLAMS